MHSAFSNWRDFWAMGGYAFYVWLAVAGTLVPLLILIFHTRCRHGRILTEVERQCSRERRIAVAQGKDAGGKSE